MALQSWAMAVACNVYRSGGPDYPTLIAVPSWDDAEDRAALRSRADDSGRTWAAERETATGSSSWPGAGSSGPVGRTVRRRCGRRRGVGPRLDE